MKKRLSSYVAYYQVCEKILEILEEATSREILSYLLLDYDVGNRNITTKGISFYLKQQGYNSRKYYKTKPQIFFSKNNKEVLLDD